MSQAQITQMSPQQQPLSSLSPEELSTVTNVEVLDGSVDLENFTVAQTLALADNLLDSLFTANYEASEFVKVNEVLLQSNGNFDEHMERKFIASEQAKL